MSEATLSKILYNSASEAAPAEDNTYESALAKTQAYLSEHHAQTLGMIGMRMRDKNAPHGFLRDIVASERFGELLAARAGIDEDAARLRPDERRIAAR